MGLAMAKRKKVGKSTSRATKAKARPAKPARAKARAKAAVRAKVVGRPKRSAVTPAAAPGRVAPMFHVDAFASKLFTGNPAAVVLLDGPWPDDQVLQAIGNENNLAETAFVLPKGRKLHIRWFTPEMEMDLCGHATLASAHVLWNHVGLDGDRLVFESRSGPLGVSRGENGLMALDFPSRPGKPVPITNQLCDALGRAPTELYRSRDLMAVFENRRDVYELKPDMAKLAALDAFAVIVTAPGSGHDFVSRFFAPGAGVPEDPVTGSAHCTLIPYWSDRLGKARLRAHQVSRRGGELWCEDRGTRVSIAGHAVTYFTTQIAV
jgi:PhzF family phenazine biosynthesis protein